MIVAETVAQTRAFVADARRAGESVGFVPTMGALHEGHWSLIERARADCDVVVTSIFVNPLQFAPSEDYEAYPRTRETDIDGCERRMVSLVFAPGVAEMYPAPIVTAVAVRELSGTLCGRSRPGHFDGVCTVVAKLLNIVQPDRAYFGEKDFQQLVIVKRMGRDLSWPVEIIGCPTVRESDGLALSSRNRYLSPEDRAKAPAIHAALIAGIERVRAGEREARTIVEHVQEGLLDGGVDSVDYVALVDPESLADLGRIDGPARLCVAAYLGGTRLIDNMPVDASPEGS